ncbi:hypothetical protein HPB51_017022 [Rhipicephalus microplus]|uniref:Uncharacterized protein n=1 Tax=Rhipicephalus microplus TaxID=6941 RepID=A0A9J6F4S5_RHIMP|nr:hypothetical protein HPB51_017022 [Rhipicephalus microplus]
MKIDTLAFLGCLLTHHSPQVFHPHIDTLLPPIIVAVGDSFYKITSEALLVLQQLVKVIRPLDQESSFRFEPYVKDIFECTLTKLKAADIDQEVKERAITCMGHILCHLGDCLLAELAVCLPIFLDRLRNEITRLTTVKALTKVAGSPLRIDLSPVLCECVLSLASFLRKNQRALKLASADAAGYACAYLSQDMVATVMQELPALINETDLHISQAEARSITRAQLIEAKEFKASSGWTTVFTRCLGLGLRRRTTLCQCLLAAYEDKVVDFRCFVIKLRQQKNFILSQIRNADQTPLALTCRGARQCRRKVHGASSPEHLELINNDAP